MSQEKALLLPSSTVFKNSNLVDCIRQSYIDLQNQLKRNISNNIESDQTKNDITALLQQAQSFLDENKDIYVIRELISIITFCFQNYLNQALPFLKDFYQKSCRNLNYILIFSSILSELIYVQPQLYNNEYEKFTKDALKEILPQIQNKNSIWTIFQHQIPHQFHNELLINLILCSKLTKELFYDFFPFIISQNIYSTESKLILLIQKFSESNISIIIPQTESSMHQIQAFITSKDTNLIMQMSPESLSLVGSALIFIINNGENMVDGLNEHSIFQFLSIVEILLQKLKDMKIDVKSSEIISILMKAIESLKIDDSSLLSQSVTVVFNCCTFKDQNVHLTFSKNSNEIEFAIIKKFINNQFKLDEKNIYETLVNYTNFSEDYETGNFLIENNIFEFIFSHIQEIYQYCVFGRKKVALSFISEDVILGFIYKLKTPDSLFEALSFIMDQCTDVPEFSVTSKFSQKLIHVFREKNNEKNLKDALIISSFIYNYYTELFQTIVDFLPKQINYILSKGTTVELNIDELLEIISISLYLDLDDSFLFANLFEEMMKDKEIRSQYFDFLVTINTVEEYRVDNFISMISKMNKYQDDLIEAVNNHFYFNEDKHILLRKLNYSLASKPIPKIGSYVVNRLYEIIEKRPDNYQSFICLYNVACAFPFLFTENSQKVFEFVLPFLNHISLMYNDEIVENKLNLVKTALCAMSFLFSSFHAPYMLDNFMNWLFPNLSKFTDEQITCFMIILGSLYNDGLFHCVIPAYIKKYNCIGIVGELLERDIKDESFRNLYRNSIYQFLILAYSELAKLRHYEIIQIDDFTRMEHPFNYMYDFIYLTSPCMIELNIIDEFKSIPAIDTFLGNLMMPINFYIYEYNLDDKEYQTPTLEQLKSFESKLEKIELSKIDSKSFPMKIFDFTIKIVDYLVMQRGFIYCWFLYNIKTTLVPPLYDILSESADKIISMQKDAEEHPKDKDNANILTFSIEDYLSPCYTQQKLYDNLLKQLIESSTSMSKNILDLFVEICKKRTGLTFLLKTISKLLVGNDSTYPYLVFVLHIVKLLGMISESDYFEELFIEHCCNNLLDIILSPSIRDNYIILQETAYLFINFKTLPIRVTQLIGFLFALGNDDLYLTMKLCSKYDRSQLSNIYNLILNGFDDVSKDNNISDEFFLYIKYCKPLVEDRRDKIAEILTILLSDFHLDDSILTRYIIILFNAIAPTKTCPSPEFWNLFEKHKKLIDEVIQKNPSLLNEFPFFLDNPELVKFQVRSLFFKETMKERICDDFDYFTIDRENVLESSFEIFQMLKNDDILNTISIEFIGEPVLDYGGARREWFELLIKELFNPSNHLFVCSKKCHSYQPSPHSSLHPNHLKYFRFAGQVIARALIEGICIDVHLSSSLYKQILHQEPTFDDLEDIDEELYKGLDWILHNDIKTLDEVFAIDFVDDISKEYKTILLKENGENIHVDNQNKIEYVNLYSNFILCKQIQQQLNAFCDGFHSLIDYESIKYFTPNEFDLLLCGIPTIDVEDFKANTVYELPYSADSPVIKLFFKVISKWNNEDLAKLLKFMTGSSRVPVNGFKEFCEMTVYPLRIEVGGDRSLLPQSHTCFNILHLPQYENEEEMNEKLHQAIQFCDTFGLI